jgi:hypothetical protein
MPVALDIQWQMKVHFSFECHFMTETTDKSSAFAYDQPGSMTTKQNKTLMINQLKRYLELGHVVFHEPFISADDTTGNVRDIKKEFIKHMENFSKISVHRVQPDGSPDVKIFYSGKAAGGNDDFVMALAIGLYNRIAFLEKGKYSHLQ